jgi:hypothetical protein
MHSYIYTASNFYYTIGKKNLHFLISILLIVKCDEYFNCLFWINRIYIVFTSFKIDQIDQEMDYWICLYIFLNTFMVIIFAVRLNTAQDSWVHSGHKMCTRDIKKGLIRYWSRSSYSKFDLQSYAIGFKSIVSICF